MISRDKYVSGVHDDPDGAVIGTCYFLVNESIFHSRQERPADKEIIYSPAYVP
ncbi:MAG: hypothetical protein GYA43_03950 [Bacteroidales bacterium]|nr:hypothetical protein [Bacteroidales bacterium]